MAIFHFVGIVKEFLENVFQGRQQFFTYHLHRLINIPDSPGDRLFFISDNVYFTSLTLISPSSSEFSFINFLHLTLVLPWLLCCTMFYRFLQLSLIVFACLLITPRFLFMCEKSLYAFHGLYLRIFIFSCFS